MRLAGGPGHPPEMEARIAKLEMDSPIYKSRLEKALAHPSGPDIALEIAPRNFLRVRNLRGGTAHNVLVHSFKSGGLTCKEHRIALIAEGGSVEFAPMIESASGNTYIPCTFETFLAAAQRSNSPEEKVLQKSVPTTVAYWDGEEKNFVSEFELANISNTQGVGITLQNRYAEIRNS